MYVFNGPQVAKCYMYPDFSNKSIKSKLGLCCRFKVFEIIYFYFLGKFMHIFVDGITVFVQLHDEHEYPKSTFEIKIMV